MTTTIKVTIGPKPGSRYCNEFFHHCAGLSWSSGKKVCKYFNHPFKNGTAMMKLERVSEDSHLILRCPACMEAECKN